MAELTTEQLEKLNKPSQVKKSSSKKSAASTDEIGAIAASNQTAISAKAGAARSKAQQAIAQYAVKADAVADQGAETIVQITNAIPAVMFMKAAEMLALQGDQEIESFEVEAFEIPEAAMPFFTLRCAPASAGELRSASH